jgi:competence protein ComEC
MSSFNLAVAVICGCGLGLVLLARYPEGLDAGPGIFLLLLALCASGCVLLATGHRRALWASLLLASVLAGAGRALITRPHFTTVDLAYHNSPLQAGSPTVEVVGIVSAEPHPADRSQSLRISAEWLRFDRSSTLLPVSGDLLAILPRYPEYTRGEQLKLTGPLSPPPAIGGFDYAAWLARQGIFSYMTFPHALRLGSGASGGPRDLIAAARASARHTLQRNLPEPQASIAVGVVVGDRSALSDPVREAFQRTGTTHILAVSGQNVMMIAGLVWLAWSGPGRKRAMTPWVALVTVAGLALYTLFTGAAAPVVRAAAMGAILLFAPVFRRRHDPMASLALTAAVMLLLDPGALADASFQLSFLCMWGITTLALPITRLFRTIRLPALLSYPLSVSLAAQVATVPLGVLLFGQLSLVSPIATLTADLALLPLMLSGIMTALLGLLPGDLLAWVAGWLAWLSSAWLLWWVEWWAQFDWAAIPVEGLDRLYAVAYYAALCAGVWLFSHERRREHLSALRPQLRVAALGATAAAAWIVAILLLLAL